MSKQPIHTPRAPAAIGPYSQAIRAGDTVYLSGQIPLVPASMELVKGDIRAQIRQVFDNLAAVALLGEREQFHCHQVDYAAERIRKMRRSQSDRNLQH